MTTNQRSKVKELKYLLCKKDHEINYLRRRFEKLKDDIEKVLEPYYIEKRWK